MTYPACGCSIIQLQSVPLINSLRMLSVGGITFLSFFLTRVSFSAFLGSDFSTLKNGLQVFFSIQSAFPVWCIFLCVMVFIPSISVSFVYNSNFTNRIMFSLLSPHPYFPARSPKVLRPAYKDYFNLSRALINAYPSRFSPLHCVISNLFSSFIDSPIPHILSCTAHSISGVLQHLSVRFSLF